MVFHDTVFVNLCQGIDRIYSDGQFCDLFVTIGNDNFSCHRLVLAAVSDFFRSLLTSSWHESSTGFVNIDHEDVTGQSFHLLLDIIYKGKDVITMETVKDVLKMSIYLRIKFLEEYCQQYLSDNMGPETYLGAWQFAEKYQLTALSDRAAKMAAARFGEVAKCNEFLHLPKSMLLILLSLQRNVSMDVCKAIFTWAEKDVIERKQHLGELLPFINFTQLAPEYVYEFMKYMDHPFSEYVLDYANESMAYTLKGVYGSDTKIQRQMKARQDVSVNVPDIKRCIVVAGGCKEKDTPLTDVYAVPIDTPIYHKVYQLTPFPELCGLHFATCVWRNEMYVCGGSLNDTHFSVYKPGDDAWESLPTLPQGRVKHAMAAVNWNIFVLGGQYQGKADKARLAEIILVYHCKSRVWSDFSSLHVAVQDTAVATLGHRIYLFGGEDAEGHATDVVQCVNTLTGCVYLAGHLPSPSFGARALSDGGTVFVIRPEGDVLEMKENFALADEIERKLFRQNTDAIAKEHKESSSANGAEAQGMNNETNETPNKDSEADVKNNYDTIRFKTTCTFPRRLRFGCYLWEEGVAVCGGISNDGLMLRDIVNVDTTTATSSVSRLMLLNESACFSLHTLNIPQEYLTEDRATAQPMRQGSKVTLTESGTNSFYKKSSLHIKNSKTVYKGPPRDSIGTVKAIDASGNYTVNFPNVGDVSVPPEYIQINDAEEKQ